MQKCKIIILICEKGENIMNLKNLINISTGCYEFQNGITEIEDNRFCNCKDLKKIIVPSSVKKIGNRAFYGCSNLESIEIRGELTELGEDAFSWCQSLNTIKIAGNIEEIKKGTFRYCSNLKNVSIPESVKTIQEDAFFGCSKLSEIDMPEKLEKISKNAFHGCVELKEMSINKNLEKIEVYAFRNCTRLKRIYVPGNIIIDAYGVIISSKYGDTTGDVQYIQCEDNFLNNIFFNSFNSDKTKTVKHIVEKYREKTSFGELKEPLRLNNFQRQNFEKSRECEQSYGRE